MVFYLVGEVSVASLPIMTIGEIPPFFAVHWSKMEVVCFVDQVERL